MPNKELEKAVVEWYNARIDILAKDYHKKYADAIQILSAKAAAIVTAKEFGLKRKKSK